MSVAADWIGRGAQGFTESDRSFAERIVHCGGPTVPRRIQGEPMTITAVLRREGRLFPSHCLPCSEGR